MKWNQITSKLWPSQYYQMNPPLKAYKTQREKARLELHKNATSFYEQILENTRH